jgi:hypothetical protein
MTSTPTEQQFAVGQRITDRGMMDSLPPGTEIDHTGLRHAAHRKRPDGTWENLHDGTIRGTSEPYFSYTGANTITSLPTEPGIVWPEGTRLMVVNRTYDSWPHEQRHLRDGDDGVRTFHVVPYDESTAYLTLAVPVDDPRSAGMNVYGNCPEGTRGWHIPINMLTEADTEDADVIVSPYPVGHRLQNADEFRALPVGSVIDVHHHPCDPWTKTGPDEWTSDNNPGNTQDSTPFTGGGHCSVVSLPTGEVPTPEPEWTVGQALTRDDFMRLPIGTVVRHRNRGDLNWTRVENRTGWATDEHERPYDPSYFSPQGNYIHSLPEQVTGPQVGEVVGSRERLASLPIGSVVRYRNAAHGWTKASADEWTQPGGGLRHNDATVWRFTQTTIIGLPDVPSVGQVVGSHERLAALPVGSVVRVDRPGRYPWTLGVDNLWRLENGSTRASDSNRWPLENLVLLRVGQPSQTANRPATLPDDVEQVVPIGHRDRGVEQFKRLVAGVVLGAGTVHGVNRDPIERCLVALGIPTDHVGHVVENINVGSVIESQFRHNIPAGAVVRRLCSTQGPLESDVDGVGARGTSWTTLIQAPPSQRRGNPVAYEVLTMPEGHDSPEPEVVTHESLAEVEALRRNLRRVGDDARGGAGWCGVYTMVVDSLGATSAEQHAGIMDPEQVSAEPQGSVFITLTAEPVIVVRDDRSTNPCRTVRVIGEVGHWAPRLRKVAERMPSRTNPLTVESSVLRSMPEGSVVRYSGRNYTRDAAGQWSGVGWDGFGRRVSLVSIGAES